MGRTRAAADSSKGRRKGRETRDDKKTRGSAAEGKRKRERDRDVRGRERG